MSAEYLAEPYRIKMVEPIRITDREERGKLIKEAGYNMFFLRSDDVYIDLLTDSGTSAMSQEQWSAMMLGDEAYAGSRSFYRLKETVEQITGYPYVLPAHQGRAAENNVMDLLVKEGMVIPGNMHFDTTRAHIQLRRGKPLDLIIDQGLDPVNRDPFKGNIDLEKLEKALIKYGKEKIPFVLLTITCNNNGGQPVSLANIKAAGALAHQYGIPLFFDVARFAENCYFIHQRENGCAQKSIKAIAREIFASGDGLMMSSKKDGLVNMGGIMAFKDRSLYDQACQFSIINEGFPTYGGMAGRDMEALARGLEDVMELPYLQFRIGQVSYLAELLLAGGVPIVEPPGGHAVYIDARRFLPHIPQEQFPAQVISVELYIEGGIRSLELGSIAFAEKDPDSGEYKYPELDLLRLAIPRRVYTNSHMQYVARHVIDIYKRRDSLKGLKMVYQPPVARHFTCRLEPLG